MSILSQIEREVLIGTLLGDAHLEKNGRYVRLKIDHGVKQKDYVHYKYHIFKEYAAGFPREISVFDRRNSQIYYHVRFSTKSIPSLTEFWDIFYQNRRKIVPQGITQFLNSTLSLAVWFMDDGARRTDCNALRIHTSAYTIDENRLLAETLRQNFCIESKIHLVTKLTYVLYIPSGEAKRFCSLIEPHIIPTMRYKLL